VKPRKEPRLIGSLVDEILAESGYLTICREYDVVRKWPSVAGGRFAEMTTCERVENGILYVKVLSAPWRQEAVYRKADLLDRIRKELGCPTIKDIVFY
jgi:predicted nucleic acid-binding Zn ribbon protein